MCSEKWSKYLHIFEWSLPWKYFLIYISRWSNNIQDVKLSAEYSSSFIQWKKRYSVKLLQYSSFFLNWLIQEYEMQTYDRKNRIINICSACHMSGIYKLILPADVINMNQALRHKTLHRKSSYIHQLLGSFNITYKLQLCIYHIWLKKFC